MKSFLAITVVIIGISIACSSSKSAESLSAQRVNATSNQTLSSPGTSTTTQDKPLCSLSMSQAPVIKGLKLGMSPDEVLALFPGSRNDPELRSNLSKPPSRFGVSSFSVTPSKYENKENFVEITQITFTMLDGRASNFTVGYNGPAWSHVDKFVESFVQGTTLPPADQWQAYEGMDNQLKVLSCTDFEVRVFTGGTGGSLNYVLMQDLEADKKLKERRKKAREQASPTPGNQ